MVAKRSAGHGAAAQARSVVDRGVAVCDNVRDMTVRTLKNAKGKDGGIAEFVDDVLEGTADALQGVLPDSRRNVVRQVFDGLREGVDAAADAGAAAARRAGRVLERDVPQAVRRMGAAQDEFLAAVSNFAAKVSGEAREELDDLVHRARRGERRNGRSGRRNERGNDGRLLELTGEAARRAADGLAVAAEGLIEGISGALSAGRSRGASRPARRVNAPRTTGRAKAGKTRVRKTGRKRPARRATTSRRKVTRGAPEVARAVRKTARAVGKTTRGTVRKSRGR